MLSMYQTSNSKWKSLLRYEQTKLLRRPITLAGHPMQDVDKVRYVNCMLLYANVLRDCASELHALGMGGSGQHFSDIEIINCIESVCAFDADLIQDQLKALLLSIRLVSPQGMSKKKIGKIFSSCGLTNDVDVRRAIAPFIALARAVLRHDAGPELGRRAKLFKIVNQMLQFTTRLTLTRLEGLEEKHMADYISLEMEMQGWTYDPLIINKLRVIIEEWTADIKLVGDTDSHGYGATKDVPRSVGTYAKWLSMQANTGLQHVEVAKLLLDTQHEAVERAANELLERSSAGQDEPEGTRIGERFVRYMCVPKGLTKKRGVSMEDTVNQYYQKIIFDRLDAHFKSHPHIGIYLDKQEYSRWVAKVGSRSGVFGTFDLSSASDTVTWTLVELLFKNTPLWPVLYNTRTQNVFIEQCDTTLQMMKAYGMGSACCFPIMSLILSAVCELANREKGERWLHVVYGDDIVVHKAVAARVAELLKLLHFKLNTDKSYMPGSCFTEACGGEYYCGLDTEPIRVSRSWDFTSFVLASPNFQARWNPKDSARRKTTGVAARKYGNEAKIRQTVGNSFLPYRDKEFTKLQMETLRELANTAFDRGMMNLRAYCIQLARQYYNDVFFSNDSRGFHSFHISNQTFKTSFSQEQGLRYRVRTLCTQTERPPEGEALRLERWFESRAVALRQSLHFLYEEMRRYDPQLQAVFRGIACGDDPDLYYTTKFIRRISPDLYQRWIRELSQLSICPNVGSASARYKLRWLPCTVESQYEERCLAPRTGWRQASHDIHSTQAPEENLW